MEVLVPISICVILPVAIVLIIFMTAMNSDNKRTKVLIKAIEANNNIDADKLAAAFAKPRKTPLEILNKRLLCGCMFTFIGIALIIVALVSLASGTEFANDSVTLPMIFGGALLAIGLSYLVVYFVTRKQVNNTRE